MDKPYKNSFERECSELATLETFNPKAFIADHKVPQPLCNFVLALALIFNDLRDLHYANILVGDCKPTGLSVKNKQRGYYSGLNLHVLRLIMSAVHELLNLVDKNREAMEDSLFRSVVKALPKDIRSDWLEVVKVGLGQSSADDKIGKLLVRIRNNVSFHYDPKAVLDGFRNHFEAEQVDESAYISRGNTVRTSRFYFADAAVDGLINKIVGNDSVNLAASFGKMLNGVSDPIALIVVGFIQKRGFGFRQEPG